MFGLCRIEVSSIFQFLYTKCSQISPLFLKVSFKFTYLCESQFPQEGMNLKREKYDVICLRSVLNSEFNAVFTSDLLNCTSRLGLFRVAGIGRDLDLMLTATCTKYYGH